MDLLERIAKFAEDTQKWQAEKERLDSEREFLEQQTNAEIAGKYKNFEIAFGTKGNKIDYERLFENAISVDKIKWQDLSALKTAYSKVDWTNLAKDKTVKDIVKEMKDEFSIGGSSGYFIKVSSFKGE